MPKIQCDIQLRNDVIGPAALRTQKLGLSVEFVAIDESPRHWTAPAGIHLGQA